MVQLMGLTDDERFLLKQFRQMDQYHREQLVSWAQYLAGKFPADAPIPIDKGRKDR